MHTRTLGRTGLSVSEIGLGTLSLSGPFKLGGVEFGRGEVDDRNSRKMVEVALDAGITLIDTADIYGYGRVEEFLGRMLLDRRDRVILSTKAGNRGTQTDWVKDFTPEWIRTACDNSLRRLKTDYIDLYVLHTPPEDFLFTEENLRPFIDLRREGKIRFYGCSASSVKQGLDFARSGFGDVVEIYYNAIEREAAEELLPLCEELDLGVILKAPLYQGLLSGKYSKNSAFDDRDFRSHLIPRDRFNRAVDVADFLKSVASGIGMTPSQLALKFSLMRKEAAAAIPGAKSAGQVLENARAGDLPELPVSVLDAIERELSRAPA